ncbi:NUDIX hydrolase [Kocuria sp. NPDC057446]|uniref:NUDIX hydrolase n=1 Tax=Kocuria sp. NPDC057446 TaxID=3346137 RepID=UPI0036CAC18F
MSFPMDTRVGAYAVIVQDGAVLLSHWNPRRPTLRGAWSLPGGGMEVGEQPAQTALREVHEETGFTVELDELLGVHSRHMDAGERLDGRDRPFHALRVIYRAHITGGTLTSELDGSSDEARWFPLAALPGLPLVSLVPVGLELAGLVAADPAGPGRDR